MNRKQRILVIGIAFLIVCASLGVTSAKTLYVDDDGGYDFTRIQEAIDEASPGDTIFVYNGTYEENLEIDKGNLTIVGENRDKVIIDGKKGHNTIYIDVRVNNIKISEFTIQNGYDNIYVAGSNFNCARCKILNGSNGITITEPNCNISECIVMNHHYRGIDLSSHNTIVRNNIILNCNFNLFS